MFSGAVDVPRMFHGIFIKFQPLFFSPCGSKYLPCPSYPLFQQSALSGSDTEGGRLTSWHQSVFRHCVRLFNKYPGGELRCSYTVHSWMFRRTFCLRIISNGRLQALVFEPCIVFKYKKWHCGWSDAVWEGFLKLPWNAKKWNAGMANFTIRRFAPMKLRRCLTL